MIERGEENVAFTNQKLPVEVENLSMRNFYGALTDGSIFSVILMKLT